MPTLLSINNYYYLRGGAETVFFEHNRVFEQLGWRVVPFSMKHPKNLATPWADHFIDEIEFGQNYSAADKLVRVAKSVYSWEARRRLERLIDEVKPDVCHAHNIYHHLSPAILGVLKRRGIPTVMTLHDLKIACPAYSMLAPDGICERCKGGRIYNVVVHRCLKGSLALSSVAFVEAALHSVLRSYDRCVNRFVVPSRFYLEKLCEWGRRREQFQHSPNFIDIDRFEPDFHPGSAFVYVGRLSREKGLATLVKAAAESKCAVTLVGTGPQQEELQALTQRLSAPVTFLGYQTGEALQSAIRSARAVVLPSEWYENAPLSVLEAYALGKPVIGARIGGIPELIRDGVTGAEFASGNVQALSAAMSDLAGQPAARVVEMGRAGRDWVERDFTAPAYRQRMLALYRELGVNGA